MLSSVRQFVLILLFLLLVIFTFWSYNWIAALIFTPVLFLFYHPKSYQKIKDRWNKQTPKIQNLLEWFFAGFLGILLILLVNTYFYSLYKVRSTSMQTAYRTGEIVVVDKFRPGPPVKINNPDKFRRLKGPGDISRYDVIVFHFPEGDTILPDHENDNYYYLKRQYRDKKFFNKEQFGKAVFKPVRRRTKYIKRVIGLPGDTVHFKEGIGMVNGKKLTPLPTEIHAYAIKDNIPEKKRQLVLKHARDQYSKTNRIFVELCNSTIAEYNLRELLDREILPLNMPDDNIFPFDLSYFWNKDNFGPVIVPRKGKTVKLTVSNLPLYYRIITAYENNTVKIENKTIYINNKPSDNYTFKMNYYWVMGDNRPHSFDSRYWGFVPDNHIIGIVEKKLYSK